MSEPTSERSASVRRGRSQRGRRRPTIAVTGAREGVAAELVRRLAQRDDVKKVVAIDAAAGEVDGVTWRVADVRDPALASKLTGVDVVVHLAVDTGLETPPVERRALNVRGTSVALTASAAAGVRRVVVVTSAMVYGETDGVTPVGDDGEVDAEADQSVVGDLVEVERLVARARKAHPWLEIVVLRPAALVGPGVDNAITRHFEAPRLLVLRGSLPLWQFCHVDDLVSALELAALGRLQDARSANVASDGYLTQDDVERISGLRRIELPAGVAVATAERLQRLGVTPAAASELDFLVHPVIVEAQRLRAAGWEPSYDNEKALRALLDEAARHTAVGTRRLDRKDATRAAAASATVALVGTAALVRRARRRRRT